MKKGFSRMSKATCAACGILLLISGNPQPARTDQTTTETWPLIQSPVEQDQTHQQQVSHILSRMSVEEKVGQIMQVEIQHITPDEVKKYHIGSVLNGGGSLPNRNKYAAPSEWLALADAYYEASMDTSDGGMAIPIIWGSDAVHGHNNVIGATLFPHNIGLGAANNPALMQKIGEATALEMRATGIDWTFAPTLAVVQNDRWGRTYESYSENPEIVKAYAGQMVVGLQGTPGTASFLDVDHVVATAKHFVGDGGTKGGDDQGDAVVSEAELRDIHAAGYMSALATGVQTAMASFSSWNGDKLHGSKYMLTDVLKGQMGFGGLIVGDWNGHGQVPGCTNASCPIAINAGLDLFMTIEEWRELYANTLAQVKSGEIPLARLDDAVSRILLVKLRAGLFEKGKPSKRGVAGQDDIIGRAEHRAIARQAVRESLVLLKNNEDLLPLVPNQRVLVAGDGAHNIGKQSGGWTISWQGTGNTNADFPGATSIFDGIEAVVKAAGGQAVLSQDGTYIQIPDVAIVVFGEDPYAEGQGDIDTLEFEPGYKSSLKLLQSFNKQNIPTVAVFLSGRPLWVSPEINASDAFVAAWLPGSEGVGVADVLFRNTDGTVGQDFKGRLSFSWPATPLQEKLNSHHAGYAPLFPLGYGLSYAGGSSDMALLPEEVEGVFRVGHSEINLFSGRPAAPWRIFIEDGSTSQVVSGAYAALPSGAAAAELVDKTVQHDAVKVSWAEDVGARFTMADGPGFDFSSQYRRGAIIGFDMRRGASVPTEVALEIHCGEACITKTSLNSVYEALEPDSWSRVELPLSCFAEDADTLRSVSKPFAFHVIGKATISFANIFVGPATQKPVSCSELE